MQKWKAPELDKLRSLYSKKPKWETDYQFAARVSKEFKKSPEAVRWQVREFPRKNVEVSFPKILLLDIETMYIVADVWGTRKVYVAPTQIEKDWSILSWSAKWLFDSKTMGQVVTPEEAINHTDQSVMAGIWKLVNEADMVVTYNGDYFDLKKLNTRFLLNGFPPPMYYKSIDLYKVVNENFAFTYGKLDWVSAILGIGRKISTSFEWWRQCAEGNKTYLDKMLFYNKIDVQLTEELYVKLRPWIQKHPNINLFSVGDVEVCPACSSVELEWNGKYQTPLGLYQAFRCQKCGGIGRSTRKQYKLKSAKVSN